MCLIVSSLKKPDTSFINSTIINKTDYHLCSKKFLYNGFNLSGNTMKNFHYTFDTTDLGLVSTMCNAEQEVAVIGENSSFQAILGYHVHTSLSFINIEVIYKELIRLPVLIKKSEVQLYGECYGLVCSKFTIPNPETFERIKSYYQLSDGFDYKSFYNKLLNNLEK